MKSVFRPISTRVLFLFMVILSSLQVPAISATASLQKTATPQGNDLCEKLASIPTWLQQAQPFHVMGPISFVGTQGLGIWLVENSEGDSILINTGCRSSGHLIEQSLSLLGKNPMRIKYLLACHAHVDHVGGHAYMQKLTGAKVLMMEQDAKVLADGGQSDFLRLFRFFARFRRVEVDRRLRDRDPITLGDLTITAHHTPGHTPGSTTFSMNFSERGRNYLVVFPDGTGITPNYRLVKKPSYNGITDDFEKTFKTLQKLKPDIWLTPHLENCGFNPKRLPEKPIREGSAPWNNRQAYKEFIEHEYTVYRTKLEAECSDISPAPYPCQRNGRPK